VSLQLLTISVAVHFYIFSKTKCCNGVENKSCASLAGDIYTFWLLFRSSLRGKKTFKIHLQWYYINKYSDTAHTGSCI